MRALHYRVDFSTLSSNDMARPLRLEYSGALWHVTSRGVEQRTIFLDDNDRRRFLTEVEVAVEEWRWRLYAYVLMSNHYHFLIQTPEPTLSRGMQQLGGQYAEWFNFRHKRVGHLFQGRFKSHPVDSETYLLEVARYIVLNPVRAGIVNNPGDWRWSSYAATAGLAPAPWWLDVETLLQEFHPLDRAAACSLYRTFVLEGISQGRLRWGQVAPSPGQRAPENVRVPSIEDIRACVEAEMGSIERRSQSSSDARHTFALIARADGRTTLAQIGSVLGISQSGAGWLLKTAENRFARDSQFSLGVAHIRRRLLLPEGQTPST